MPDAEEDLRIGLALLGVVSNDKVDRGRATARLQDSRGSIAATLYAPDVAYQLRDEQAQPLYSRYHHDIA